MNWSNLKYNECPKCSTALEYNSIGDNLYCDNYSCDFIISQRAMKEVVSNIVSDEIEEEEEQPMEEGWGKEENIKPRYIK